MNKRNKTNKNNNKNVCKRVLILALCMSMLLGFTGCNENDAYEPIEVTSWDSNTTE